MNFFLLRVVSVRIQTMRYAMLVTALFVPLLLRSQQVPLTANEIMARVAANQDKADAERIHFVYTQHVRIASRKGKSLICQEITDSRVAPVANGSSQTLLRLDGRLLRDRQYITYDELPTKHPKPEIPKDLQDDTALSKAERQKRRDARRKMEETEEDDPMDRDLVENLRKSLTDEKSKDGLAAGLFPLTSKAQSEYDYTLKGQERRNGRDVYHLTFQPRDKDDYNWRGDAWIDTQAFQPVMVQTAMAKNIPFAVRMLLGVSLPGLGFSATYAPQTSGTWFPVTFGSEFKINVLFFFHRTIAISVENRDFEKTHVESHIVSVGVVPQSTERGGSSASTPSKTEPQP